MPDFRREVSGYICTAKDHEMRKCDHFAGHKELDDGYIMYGVRCLNYCWSCCMRPLPVVVQGFPRQDRKERVQQVPRLQQQSSKERKASSPKPKELPKMSLAQKSTPDARQNSVSSASEQLSKIHCSACKDMFFPKEENSYLCPNCSQYIDLVNV